MGFVNFEVAVPNSPYGLCGRKSTLNLNYGKSRKHWGFVNFEVAVPSSPYNLYGRKATLNLNYSESRNHMGFVNFEVAVTNSSYSLCGRKQHQSSGAVSKWRWPSWAPRPYIVTTVSMDVKQH